MALFREAFNINIKYKPGNNLLIIIILMYGFMLLATLSCLVVLEKQDINQINTNRSTFISKFQFSQSTHTLKNKPELL